MADLIPQIPDDYLISIGRVTVEWVSLDGLFNAWLAKIAGMDIMDARSLIVFHHASVPSRMNMMTSMIEILKGNYPKLDKFKEAAILIRKAQKSRNKIVHSSFTVDPDSGQVIMASKSVGKRLNTEIRPIQIGEINSVTDDIHAAMQVMHECFVAASG